MKINLTLLLLFISAMALQSQSFNAAAFTNVSNNVQTTFDPNFGANQDFSIEFRVKTNGWVDDPSLVSDKNWQAGLNPGFNIALGQGNSGIDVNVSDGTTRADLEAGNVNDGLWHHVLVTFDRNGNVSLYIDRVLVQAATMAAIGNINSPFNLRIAQDGTGYYPVGTTAELSEIKVWNKVLPLSEAVRCDSIDNSHPSWNDLLAYWKLNEGAGANANDSKGNNPGLIIGGASWTTNNEYLYGCGAKSIGSGYALTLDGQNDWADCSNNGGNKASAVSLSLPTQNLTLEAWVKPARYRTWDGIVSFIQDNGNFERGWDLEVRDNNKFAFALQSQNAGGMTYLETNSSFLLDEWYHVAGVYDGTTMSIYVNGVLESTSTNESGTILYADSWLALGMYRDDNEQNPFFGQLDEVRIWDAALGLSEIRDNMCKRLSGNEANLLNYWRLDEQSGATVYGEGGQAQGGVAVNANLQTWRTFSGAPLGNTSVQIYAPNWNNQSLTLTSNGFGGVTIDQFSGATAGVHLYRVDSLPYSTNGINDIGDNNAYFGVFGADNAAFNYYLQYNYANYPMAVNNDAGLYLYNRPEGAVQVWSVANATSDTLNNLFVQNNNSGRKEIILAEFTGLACPPPSGLDTADVQNYSATLYWQGTGGSYNIQYGLAGFSFGQGITVGNVTDTFLVVALAGNTAYDFYVQNNCGGANSGWAGPFSFSSADPCPTPANVTVLDLTSNSATIGWDSPNTNFIIEWGPSAFFNQPGIGIQTAVNSNPFTLSGLLANTPYTFFIRADCDSVMSAYVGPFNFTTDTVANGIENIGSMFQTQLWLDSDFSHCVLMVNSEMQAPLTLDLFNALGQPVETYEMALNVGSSTHTLALPTLAPGAYAFRLSSGGATLRTHFMVIP